MTNKVMLPVYILSRANDERFHTPRLLLKAKVPFKLVVDTQEESNRARGWGCSDIIVSKCKNIVDVRNFISELNGTNWYIGLDDNIQDFSILSKTYFNEDSIDPTDKSVNWRKEFRTTCSPQEFIHQLSDISILCEKQKTVLGGVSTTENPYFRANKYAHRRFVKTKAFVMKAGSGLVFKHTMCHDSYITAQAVAMYGRVVVNNFLFYTANWYESGGLGSRQKREEKGLLTQMNEIIKEFPGLVAVGKGENTALRILLTSDKSVNAWRKVNGYQPGGLF